MNQKHLIRLLTVALITAAGGSTVSAESERVWSGTWNNRKFGTTGPLKCVATESKSGEWGAVFTGTFKGDPFEYKTRFQSRPAQNGLELGGSSTIRGHQYEWTGALRGSQLLGQYRSTVGYYGGFQLKENTGDGATSSATDTDDSAATASSSQPQAVIQDGERMLFVGNSYTANEGGVFNYLKKALQVASGPSITTDKQIYYGQPLRSMLTEEVRSKIESDNFDSIVITSDRLGVMKRFESIASRSGKKTIVFMTWEGQHPGNRATEAAYTEATKQAVEEMRRMEAETGATIVPAAVVYHDLTLNPPARMPRVDYLWIESNIHQNELGTMVNTWMFYAMLTGKSPVGVNFDLPPFVDGQSMKKTPEIKLTPELQKTLQERVWKVAQAWRSGKTHLE